MSNGKSDGNEARKRLNGLLGRVIRAGKKKAVLRSDARLLRTAAASAVFSRGSPLFG